jgi:hypothetical protein
VEQELFNIYVLEPTQPDPPLSFDECIYYLTRESFNCECGRGPNYREDPRFFEGALKSLPELPRPLLRIEILMLTQAAQRRDRISDLDPVMEAYFLARPDRPTQRVQAVKVEQASLL